MTKEIILVVDDEQNIIELARLYLEQDGFKVIAAHTGKAALERIKTESPALMVLDLMLPEIDGKSAARSARIVICPSSC
jgi:DNA-binding response OmpR family regulator